MEGTASHPVRRRGFVGTPSTLLCQDSLFYLGGTAGEVGIHRSACTKTVEAPTGVRSQVHELGS